MPMIYAANKSAWDFLNPNNWAINKSPEQNLRELATGTQILTTVIPEALAYKMAQEITAGLVTKTSQAALTQATTTTAAGAGAGSMAGAGAITAAALAPVLTTGIKAGAGLIFLDWLKQNWWIFVLLGGGYLLLKSEGGKR